jgi:hypothetical protein
MKNQTENYTYEIKISRTNKQVPVINNVHLHSIYNPEKEAIDFVIKNQDALKAKNCIVVLGLGFGYHIKEIIKTINKFHKNYKLYIIEPNQIVVDDCLSLDLIDKNNQNIILKCGKEVKELYQDHDLVNTLSEKPLVLAHPASFNLYAEYFKSFLTHNSDNSIKGIRSNLVSSKLNEYFTDVNQDQTLDEYINQYLYNKKKLDNPIDYFLLSLKELTENSHQDNMAVDNE